ncbi:glucosylceramidase, partial [candidate division KSB1 bacterium]
YIIAHAAKFVRPGSRRVHSTSTPDLPNVAFMTAGNRLVIIVLNDSQSRLTFNIEAAGAYMHSTLSAGAVGTYIWQLE